MKHHENVVLQQWVWSWPVKHSWCTSSKRIRRTQCQDKEKDANKKHGGNSPAHHGICDSVAVLKDDAACQARKDQKPQQNGAFKCAPHSREVVQRRSTFRTNFLNVRKREIASNHCPFHCSKCRDGRNTRQSGETWNQSQHFLVFVTRAHNGRNQSEECTYQPNEKSCTSERAC